jgi:hypothetical protein
MRQQGRQQPDSEHLRMRRHGSNNAGAWQPRLLPTRRKRIINTSAFARVRDQRSKPLAGLLD